MLQGAIALFWVVLIVVKIAGTNRWEVAVVFSFFLVVGLGLLGSLSWALLRAKSPKQTN